MKKYFCLFCLVMLFASCSSSEDAITATTSNYNENTFVEEQVPTFNELLAKNPQVAAQAQSDRENGLSYFSSEKINERNAKRLKYYSPEQNAQIEADAQMRKVMCQYLAFEGNNVVLNLSAEEAAQKGIDEKKYNEMLKDVADFNRLPGSNLKEVTIYYSSFSPEHFTLLNPNCKD